MKTKTGRIFLEDLDRIDVTLFSPISGVTGHSWHVDLSISGRLDENGFVHDFSPLKSEVKAALKGTVDHALVIPASNPDVDFRLAGDQAIVQMVDRTRAEPFTWQYEAPAAAVLVSPGIEVCLEQVAWAIEARVRETLPREVDSIQVGLRSEAAHDCEAFFSYTHGITGHQGLCQRLLHGHRSKIKVEIDEQRRPEWEHRLAQEVLRESVHIAAPWQIKRGQVEAGFVGSSPECSPQPIELSYTASLGSYRAVVPSDRVLLIDGETSIENLTSYLAQIVRAGNQSARSVRVTCYEGIGKGSVASA